MSGARSASDWRACRGEGPGEIPPDAMVLSHRLRGFAEREHSADALRHALQLGVSLFEVDTRHTADDRIVLQHDPFFPRFPFGRSVRSSTLEQLRHAARSDADERRLVTLEELLDLLVEYPSSRVVLDLKDSDLSERYVEAIERRGLSERVCFVSWCPAALLGIHSLAPQVPLHFSHLGLMQHRPGVRSVLRVMLGGLLPFLNAVSFMTRAVFYLDAEDSSLHRKHPRGYSEVHLLTRPPQGRVGQALRVSGGGVAVSNGCITAQTLSTYRAAGLLVWSFSLRKQRHLDRFGTTGWPDVAFSDVPAWVSRNLPKTVE
jgi:glycerophosphoryl diester phosphodiesterase